MSAQDVVEISTVDQLKAFRDAVNSGNTYAGKTVKLTADLDLSGESNWTPIGNLVAYPSQSFNGTFDGDGHSISNVTVNDNTPNHAVAGLFGSVVNGTIKNLTVRNVDLTSTHYAGGIVAYTSNGPTIENCKVIGGTIKSTPEIVNGSYDNGDKVGGIMGYATGASTGENPHPASTINNCWVEDVTITAYRDLGGIVGYSAGTVTNNTAKNVTVTQDLTNGYKDPTPTTIGDIIGRDGGATLSNNIVIKSNPVAQIGETKYETIAEAVTAANAGDVIEVIKAGDYTLPNISKNVTIEGAVDGVVFNHTTAGSVASIPNGATFKNVTFNFGNVNYHGFQHAGTINMDGCTLNGKLFSYGDMNFTDCSFNQSNSDYHMWNYSGNVTYTDCTFTNSVTGKFLNVYNESGATKYTVTATNCKFVNQASSANKAALNVKATSGSNLLAYDVIINNCTTEGAFPEASTSDVLVVLNSVAQVDDRPSSGVDNITVTQDGVLIYPAAVAAIGEIRYPTLQAAVNAAQQMGGEVTVKIIDDINGETVTIKEVANFKLTIDGKKDESSNYTVDALIVVDGLRGNGGSTTNGASVTLQNIAFVKTTSTDGIQASHYPHNLTIQDCTYIGSDNDKWFLNASVDGPLYGVTVKNVMVEHARLIYANMADDAVFQNINATNDCKVGFNVKTSGTVLIENCQVTTGKYAFRDYSDAYEGTFTLKDNTLISTTTASDEGAIVNRGGAVGTAHINVESGTYIGALKVMNNKQKVLVISGGKFSAPVGDAEYAGYFAEGLCGVNGLYEGDAPNGVGTAVASITTSETTIKFATFEAAVDAATSGETIELLANITDAYTMGEGQTLKVKKNGFSVTIKAPEGFILKSSTPVDGVITYTIAEPDLMYTDANGTVSYKAWSNTVITSNGTYKLLKDVTAIARIVPGMMISNVTLDLNGFTLTSTATDAAFYLSRAGTAASPKVFNIVNTSENGGGKVVVNPEADKAIEINGNYNNVTIGEGVTIDGGCVAVLKNNDILTVEGTVNGGDDFAIVTNGGTTTNATITIKNGAILTSTGTAMYLPGTGTTTIEEGVKITGSTGIYIKSATLNIEGGEITGNGPAADYSYNNNGCNSTGQALVVDNCNYPGGAPVVNITGGKFTTVNNESAIGSYAHGDGAEAIGEFVHGGYFSTELPREICEAGKKTVPSTTVEGYYELGEVVFVAQIGDTKYESLADAVAAVPADGTETTIEMIANEMIDVVGSAITIPTNKNVVIDLNGFQVVGTAAGGSTSALITNKGTLTIKDSSDTNKDGTGTGQLISGATTTWIYEGDGNYAGSYASNTITNSGTLTIESGYVENLSTGSATYAVDNNSSGGNAILNMNGGLLKARSVAVREFANSTTLKNEVNVTGGTIQAGYSGIWIQLPGSDATKAMKASLNVTGGTLTGGSYAFYDYSYGNSFDATQYNLSGGTFNGYVFSYGANINITDGTYNGDVAIKQTKPSEVTVSGGKFGGDVYTYGDNASEGFITGGVYAINSYEYEGNTYDCDWLYCLADGYVVSDNTDPETKDAYPYTVRKANYICAIGTTKYETLAEAVAAAGTAETTITLLTEAATDGVISGDGVVVPSGSNITFDLNGLTYNVSGETVGSSGTKTSGFQLLKESNITFKNGTLKATAPTAQMLIQNYSNLTLEDVNLDGTALSGWAYALSNNCGTINLTGSTSITAKNGGRAFDTCKFGSYAIPTVNINTTGAITGPIEATGGKLNIENGKFNVTWVTDSHYAAGDIQISGGVFSTGPADEYLAEGYVVVDNTDEATMNEYPYTVKSKEDAGIFDLFDDIDYARTDDVQATKVTYTRYFSPNVTDNYQAWYIPFDYTIKDEDADIFDFYKIHLISASNKQDQDDLIEDNTKVYIHIEPIPSGTVLKANRPYVIKPKAEMTHVFEAESVTLYGMNNSIRLSMSTSEWDYNFYGTYTTFKEENQTAKQWIGLNTNGNYFWNKPSSSLHRYRWFIKVTANTDNGDYSKLNLVFIEDNDEATDISKKYLDEDEIEGIYTLDGVKVQTPVKGMNIIRFANGKTKKINVKK